MGDNGLSRIGFIGLGIMGGRMAANLQKAGYALVVNDIRRAAAEGVLADGAEWADTPKEVAARCEAVFTCLPGASQVEAVALGPDGIIHGVRPGFILVEMSTNSFDLAKRINEAFAARGAHVLDAPISGGARGAESRRLAIWVGGAKEIFEKLMPALKAMGNSPVHVGSFGSGLVTKLVHNSASQTMQAALAEIFAMGVKAGAEPRSLWEALRQGAAGTRRSFDCLAPEYLAADFDGKSALLRLIYKDMLLATELAREIGAPMRFANLALADITEAMNRGWGENDQRRFMTLSQERLGIAIKVEPADIEDVFRRDPAAPSDPKNGKLG